MIYEVNVRIVKESTVFVEAETQDEARKAATSEEVVGNIHENPKLLEEKG